MRINHNISSMIGQGALDTQQVSLSKSLEKLSTGLRINRASDDAAGLSVSESLRAKVRGMGRAKTNAEDGIALLQIAEGATGEINNILQRMRELAIQSSTDTMTTTERSYTDKEFGQLMSRNHPYLQLGFVQRHDPARRRLRLVRRVRRGGFRAAYRLRFQRDRGSPEHHGELHVPGRHRPQRHHHVGEHLGHVRCRPCPSSIRPSSR